MAPPKRTEIKESMCEFIIENREGSELIMHNWSPKALEQMRQKHAGKKTKAREPRNPDQEFKDAMYLTADGKLGIPKRAFRKALINAAHKDIGIEKTIVRKAIFLKCDDPNQIIAFEEHDEPENYEAYVRVGATTDLRYRPKFKSWKIRLKFDYDSELLQEADIANLITRAGFGVGVLEDRPDKDGECGRFQIAKNQEEKPKRQTRQKARG